MRLVRARVQNYRSVRDTGYFDIEEHKTIMVGPNEAGKTAVLRALQQIKAPEGIEGFDALRDYPRALYNDIATKKVNPATIPVVEVEFSLDDEDKEEISEEYHACTYTCGRNLDNSSWHRINGGPDRPVYNSIKNDLLRLAAHVESRVTEENKTQHTLALSEITKTLKDGDPLVSILKPLKAWLQKVTPLVDEDNQKEEDRLAKLGEVLVSVETRIAVLGILEKRVPVFVLYSNYFRVRPIIHLEHLAQRLESGVLDDKQYDYGNQCLLKLLGFTARELSNLGKAGDPDPNNATTLEKYRSKLDNRGYQLNAASVRLTREICSVWVPNPDRAEADRLRIQADGQYLKVVVEDELGVEIELDQRSEGFQWLVSFFVVFFAEAEDKNENAILLLDEPGLSLHALKQRDFRQTITRLAAKNQTIYTTHSPFLVGPDELDVVRVVEMTDRNTGTKIHTNITANDPAALLPLQEALGYDLAQSLFTQQRNLILEGLTDYWYIESVSALLRDAGLANLNERIAMVPANTAGKVVYFATILHAQKLKVAALLDSDNAGDQAAKQEVLVHTLGNKRILRTKDHLKAAVGKAEIEDLLRETLINVAKNDLGWDVAKEAKQNPSQPIMDVFSSKITDFSKYKLAKAFLRWGREHEARDLTKEECDQWVSLVNAVNTALK